jgi:N-carbamoyl-L-amino-acid hydrolase
MQIDQERLRADIERNGEFGATDADEGRGRTLLTGSDADGEARSYFVSRLEDAGLDVRVDAVGNIAGRWTPESADPDAAPVAVGSHLDSVPEGGIFDGPLGVYAALEAVRALQEGNVDPDRPVEVVSFTEEEGARFDVGLLGSSVAAGVRDVDEVHALTDDEGVTLAERLDDVGFRGEGRLDAAEWDAWAELHIEQDTTLEDAGEGVGVVDAIAGITNCRARVTGEANHAGATPMAERRDALTAASTFALDVERAANEVVAERSETAVATVGKFDVSPNAKNVVPGEVRMLVDVRDVDHDAIDAMCDAAEESLDRIARDRPVDTEFDRYRDLPPTRLADRCVDAALDAADAEGVPHRRMHSAALHDTAHVAGVADAVMLFAPSEDGVSHNPREWTDWADCAAATRVLARTVASLATDDGQD